MLTRPKNMSLFSLSTLLGVLILAALASEFFQNPGLATKEFSQLNRLFRNDQLEQLKTITVKNNLGSFTIEKSNKTWELTSPRTLPANLQIANALASSLKKFSVKKVWGYDSVNISNYSLEDPLFSLILGLGNEKLTLDFGMQNSIDNSIYMAIKERNAIYNVQGLSLAAQSLDLSDFIEARILPLNAKQVQKVMVYKKGSNSSHLNLSKKDFNWFSGKTEINTNKVTEFFTKLFTFKSLYIIDQKDEKQESIINKLFEKPAYTAQIDTKDGQKIKLEISDAIGSFPGLKLEKWKNVIVRVNNNKYPYIVSRKIFSILNKKDRHFKSISIKKLFY